MRHHLEAGAYYVGDPSYLLSVRGWATFNRIVSCSGNRQEGHFVIAGVPFVVYDLELDEPESYWEEHDAYCVNSDNEYFFGVESGLIACVRTGLVIDGMTLHYAPALESIRTFHGHKFGGHLIDFPEDFMTESYEGTIRFGHVSIDTSTIMWMKNDEK